jgi:hypothetical protein
VPGLPPNRFAIDIIGFHDIDVAAFIHGIEGLAPDATQGGPHFACSGGTESLAA